RAQISVFAREPLKKPKSRATEGIALQSPRSAFSRRHSCAHGADFFRGSLGKFLRTKLLLTVILPLAWLSGGGSDGSAASASLRRKFVLTFDDGPLPGKTDLVLDAVKKFTAPDGSPVKVAFFMIGDAPRDPLAARRYFAPYEVWIHKG